VVGAFMERIDQLGWRVEPKKLWLSAGLIVPLLLVNGVWARLLCGSLMRTV
jgi:hypothetical protein